MRCENERSFYAVNVHRFRSLWFDQQNKSFTAVVRRCRHAWLQFERLLSPHLIPRHIVYCMFLWLFLWVTPATKSTKFGSRYLGEGSSERDEILQVARGGVDVPHHPTVTFGPGCQKFGNAFLQGGFTDLGEI